MPQESSVRSHAVQPAGAWTRRFDPHPPAR